MGNSTSLGEPRAVDPTVVPGQVGSPQHAYLAELDLEFARWSEITALVRILTPEERLAPGYFNDPSWTVKDLVAHLAAWLAEAATQLADIAALSYVPHDVNVDARNDEVLAATKEDPWEFVWARATRARAEMLQSWFLLRGPTESATWWVRKAGAEHYGEHLERLRAWVAELVDARTRPPSDDWDS
jgi:hypothetical protein